jgi:hypothetical protein
MGTRKEDLPKPREKPGSKSNPPTAEEKREAQEEEAHKLFQANLAVSDAKQKQRKARVDKAREERKKKHELEVAEAKRKRNEAKLTSKHPVIWSHNSMIVVVPSPLRDALGIKPREPYVFTAEALPDNAGFVVRVQAKQA